MSEVVPFYLCGGFSIIFIITGLISLFIGIFNYKSNFIGLLTGYILILIAIMCVLIGLYNSGDSTTSASALKIMNVCPFIIMLISIIYLITILIHNRDKIDNLFPPMQYYDKNSNALLTLILIIIIYSTAIAKNNITSSTKTFILDVDVPFVLLFFALWFFGYVVIIRDILLFNTTDDRNEYYIKLQEVDTTNEQT
jgi:hypothetical protein